MFESQNDDDDSSNIVVTGVENDDFTIAYADSDVQVFIESFDTNLEMITDGAWDSGESLTVRLTNENLNLNTLTEQKIEIDGNPPVLIRGDPVTLGTVESMEIADKSNWREHIRQCCPRGYAKCNRPYNHNYRNTDRRSAHAAHG